MIRSLNYTLTFRGHSCTVVIVVQHEGSEKKVGVIVLGTWEGLGQDNRSGDAKNGT